MGKKKSKVKVTEQEKLLAATGYAEYKIFKNLYLGTDKNPGPLLTMRDQAAKEDFSKLFQGRAVADVQQKLAGPNYAQTFSLGTDVDMGSALASGTAQSKESAIKARAGQQTQVLAAARKQAASNQQSLGRSASIDSNLALAKYNAKQSRRAEQLNIALDTAKFAMKTKMDASATDDIKNQDNSTNNNAYT